MDEKTHGENHRLAASHRQGFHKQAEPIVYRLKRDSNSRCGKPDNLFTGLQQNAKNPLEMSMMCHFNNFCIIAASCLYNENNLYL